jgi:hypothetical protein
MALTLTRLFAVRKEEFHAKAFPWLVVKFSHDVPDVVGSASSHLISQNNTPILP